MGLRKAIFWIHLVAGLVTGGVVAVMSVTGIGIAFKEEILEWADREASRIEAPAAGAKPLAIEALRERIEAEHPEFHPEWMRIPRDPGLAWQVHGGEGGLLQVDPFSGKLQETRSAGIHAVLDGLEEWHRWLGAKEGPESMGRLVTGVSNLAFVVLCATGLWLWFPRRWSWRAVRPLVGLVMRYRGKARDFNWHVVCGLWALPVLLVLGLTAVAISFEWGHRLVFTLAGEEAPKSRNYGMMAVPPPVVPARADGTPRVALDTAVERVTAAYPDWKSLELTFPEAGAEAEPVELGVNLPDFMPSRAYIPVKADPYSGEILQAVRFQDRSAGLQARVWIRFLHTGGAFGVPGKIAASLACVAALVLVWTGFALSWRRFFGRRRPPAPAA